MTRDQRAGWFVTLLVALGMAFGVAPTALAQVDDDDDDDCVCDAQESAVVEPFYYELGDNVHINGEIQVCAETSLCYPQSGIGLGGPTVPAECWVDDIDEYIPMGACATTVTRFLLPSIAEGTSSLDCGYAHSRTDGSTDLMVVAGPASLSASALGFVSMKEHTEVKCDPGCSPPVSCANARSTEQSDTTITIDVNVCTPSYVLVDAMAWAIGSCGGTDCPVDPILTGSWSLAGEERTVRLYGVGMARHIDEVFLPEGSHVLTFEYETSNELACHSNCNDVHCENECVQAHAFDLNVQVVGSETGDPAFPTTDCNENGILDEIEISNQPSLDFDGDGILDECEFDCNANGMPDDFEIQFGLSSDCDGNGLIDDCEIFCAPGLDSNNNGILDICE